MQTKAVAKFVRMSPKKVRLVADAIRGLETERALATLRFMNKKATTPVAKAIESAVANAVHNFELDRRNLFVKEIRIDDAPTIKRWMPRAHGRATPIRKRNSHITVVIAEVKDSGEKAGKRSELEAPVKVGEMAAPTETKPKKGTKKAKSESVEEGAAEAEAKETRPYSPRGTARTEGGRGKGFASKIFRRKAG